jgi:nucleotide-binding universal stress UspA family protein
MAKPRIVVGVDGSEGSRRVVERAAVLARALDADLHAIHTYVRQVPTPRGYGLEAVPAARSRLMAQERLAGVLASLDPADRACVTSYEVVCGRADRSLVDGSRWAELLVVGSRGPHGALRGALMGSVADYCVRHAACPVLVVRPERQATRDVSSISSNEAAPAR